jgi:hypothetical protein
LPKTWNRIKDKVQEESVSRINGTIRITKVESERDEVAPIVRLVVNDINIIPQDRETVIEKIEIETKHNNVFTFYPPDNQDYDMYRQAISIAKNTKRMR